ncbi:MAG: electron transport complex subunit RsxD [Gammaproteobacteria bacterium]|nr:electron transport complex subunit RsxD [Gammaproteobacteria bacterium]
MRFNTATSPHDHSQNKLDRLMLHVVLALLPGTAALYWYFGWGVLINIVIAVAVAWISEAFILLIRQRPVFTTLKDNSALVTAWLLAIALPPLAPWWLTALGVSFAIVFAKQLYGGLGYNPFNPAMIGYVVLLISFPLEMTQWLAPVSVSGESLSLQQTMQIIFFHQLPVDGWDALSGATPLDKIKTELALLKTIPEIKTDPLFGYLGGRGWEWAGFCYLLGGLYLIYKKIISWHTPVAVLSSMLFIAFVFYLFDSEHYASPLFHIFAGGALLGAFFIATDPVSSCTSSRGKLFYGAGIGVLTYVIRTWGGYPDGIAFAVLLMNMSAPFIDYYTKPRVYGLSKQ